MILIGLGSNVGDREGQLRRAREGLEAAGVRVLKQSTIIETPAMLPEDAPGHWDSPFLNQVLLVETEHTPEALLACAKRVELALGRQVRGRWSPREIDIDLLAYGDETYATSTLTLPHPGIVTRDFVLKPLAEIAPDWRHPALGRTARELLA